jgi:hypothetical protein
MRGFAFYGTVTGGDLQAIFGYVNGTSDLSPLQRARADVNGDSRVDRLDAELVQLILSGTPLSLNAAKRASESAHFATTDGYFVIGKQIAGAPPTNDCNSNRVGAMAIDTANLRVYTCFASGWRFSQTQ